MDELCPFHQGKGRVGHLPRQYADQGPALPSTSQPVRLVSNSSFPNKSKKSLNSNTLTGPPLLGNGLQCIFAWRYHSIGVSSDLSRFYRSIETCSMTNNLRHFVWFRNPKLPSTETVFKYVRGKDVIMTPKTVLDSSMMIDDVIRK